jgi:hypothetical protein
MTTQQSEPSTGWSLTPTLSDYDLTAPKGKGADGLIEYNPLMAAWVSFPKFMRMLRDDKGNPLTVPRHIRRWCDLMTEKQRLCLMAARDHGKTWTVLAYIAWRLWRHNRHPMGYLLEDRPHGNLEIAYFSAIIDLSKQRFERLQQFLLDNEHLFADILPSAEMGDGGKRNIRDRESWSKTSFTLKNDATCYPKSIGSMVRGLHPQIVVADDIVADKNSQSALQRGRVWAFLIGTIEPMAGPKGQLLVLGTPQHQADALHKLKDHPEFKWVKFRAVDWDAETVLWPERYGISYLRNLQKADPVLFSREYQMDPRDDASSIFPYTLTARPIELAENMSWRRPFKGVNRTPGDIVVAGGDLALSEAVGADYTVHHVAVWNKHTQKRRTIWVERHKGLTFDQQVSLIRDLCRDFDIDVFCLEENNFQKWLKQHLRRFPETATRVFGHTTGIEKQSLEEGIPSLKLVLEEDLWAWPVHGGPEQPPGHSAEDFVAVFRNELSAFGWQDGKLGGVGEHDDTVTSWWLLERAIRIVSEFLPRVESNIVTIEDILPDFEPVDLGPL